MIGLIIEGLVAILLTLTIGYCMMLNRRLKLLKGDEDALRATISELLTATEMAERAIAGLKITARECDVGLGERLIRAERLCVELDRKLGLDAGARVAERPSPATPERRLEEPGPAANDPQALAAAAHAFAERLRNKVYGRAA